MATLFLQMKRYVGFADADEQALRGLHPLLAPLCAQRWRRRQTWAGPRWRCVGSKHGECSLLAAAPVV